MRRALKIVGLVIAALVALLVALSFFVDPEEESSRERRSATDVRTPVELNGITYTVTRVRIAQRRRYTESGTAVEAQGIFVIVDLRLKNVSDEPVELAAAAVRLLGGNGKTYSGRPAEVIYSNLQPEFTERHALVFDVGPKAVSGARLELEDCRVESIPLIGEPTGECETATIKLGRATSARGAPVVP